MDDYQHNHIVSHEVWMVVQGILVYAHLDHMKGQIIHSCWQVDQTSVVAKFVGFHRCIV